LVELSINFRRLIEMHTRDYLDTPRPVIDTS